LAAHAQPGMPMPVGATRITEPLSYTPKPQPVLVPGPITPEMAPVGPPDTLSLPAGHTGAFQAVDCPPATAPFPSIGALGLKRNRLNNQPIVFLDLQNNRVDTGIIPTGSVPEAFRLTQLRPDFSPGERLTVGYLWGDHAVEFTGFYIHDKTE